jgi:micrococcal nuclease
MTQATERPTKKPKTTPKPTNEPSTGYYRPPGWDGHSDVDCGDFDTHAHAQSFFKGTGGTTTNDPYRLDADSDGLACESLP